MSTSNISWGIRAIGMTKNIWWKCVQLILINAKLQIGKEAQKTELTGRSPQRRGRSALDCSAIKEDE
jgi:ABC-type taurine transport system ATPase subunit